MTNIRQSITQIMDGVTRIGVSLDPELLALFDKLITERGYVSRSEAIRDLIRETLSENDWHDESQYMFGAITIIFDSSVTGILDKLGKMQIQLGSKVKSTTRIALEDSKFLDVITMSGQLKELKEITREYTSLKGVLRGKLTMVSPVKGHTHFLGSKN